MKEELISFETAKLAKYSGFNIYTNGSYDSIGNISQTHYIFNHHNLVNSFPKPTQSLLQKWLREKHTIIVYPAPVIPDCKEFGCNVYQNTGDTFIEFNTPFHDSWEKAFEEGLQEALKLIKQQ